MNRIIVDHCLEALNLFRDGKKWILPKMIKCYRESASSKKLKILSLEVSAESPFDERKTKKVPYLRYYYNIYNKETQEVISEIKEFMHIQYYNNNLVMEHDEDQTIDWTSHCVYQEKRMVRLTTLHKKFNFRTINELKHLIDHDEKLKLVKRDSHYYVTGLRFRRARCLDTPR